MSRDATAAIYEHFRDPNETSPTAHAVLLALAHCYNEQSKLCCPSNKTLNALTHLSEKAIRNARKELVDKGIISYSGGIGHTSIHYTFLCDIRSEYTKKKLAQEEIAATDPISEVPKTTPQRYPKRPLRGTQNDPSEVPKTTPIQINTNKDKQTTDNGLPADDMNFLMSAIRERLGKAYNPQSAKVFSTFIRRSRVDSVCQIINDFDGSKAKRPCALLTSQLKDAIPATTLLDEQPFVQSDLAGELRANRQKHQTIHPDPTTTQP